MDRAEREATIEAWSRPPVAGVNLSPLVPLGLSDPMFKTWLLRTRKAHWAQPRAAHIRKLMPFGERAAIWQSGREKQRKLRVLDFGCGFGMDALEYIDAGHEVAVADINPLNLAVTMRAANVVRRGALSAAYLTSAASDPVPDADGVCDYSDWPPVVASDLEADLITMNGVLHHVPRHMAHKLIQAADRLTVGTVEEPDYPRNSNYWIMVYTDKAWRDVTKSDPPENGGHDHPMQRQFAAAMDDNGHFATFYTEEALAAVFEKAFYHPPKKITWTPIDPDGWFAVSTIDLGGCDAR